MTNRRRYIGGNWKMNTNLAGAKALAESLIGSIGKDDSVEVVICPPFPYLQGVGDLLHKAHSRIRLGAQDVYHQANGAFTGEVSCEMLKDLGVSVVLTGHSERRHVLGESDDLINRKTRAALAAGLQVILCIGETMQQREAGQTDSINLAQLYYGLAGVAPDQMARVTLAYEPVWAIGTGKTATPDDAQSAHAVIRGAMQRMYGPDIASETRIMYGGSVKGSNAAELFQQDDVDGGLIGGASLKADEFTSIVRAAR